MLKKCLTILLVCCLVFQAAIFAEEVMKVDYDLTQMNSIMSFAMLSSIVDNPKAYAAKASACADSIRRSGSRMNCTRGKCSPRLTVRLAATQTERSCCCTSLTRSKRLNCPDLSSCTRSWERSSRQTRTARTYGRCMSAPLSPWTARWMMSAGRNTNQHRLRRLFTAQPFFHGQKRQRVLYMVC